jgi:hypothetical protein
LLSSPFLVDLRHAMLGLILPFLFRGAEQGQQG